MAKHAMPLTRLDLCLFGIVKGKLSALLALQDEEFDDNGWGLPSGTLRTDLDNDLDSTAKRVAFEHLNLRVESVRQEGAVGGRTRDPRHPWTLNVVYRAQIRAEDLADGGAKKAQDLKWFSVIEAGNLQGATAPLFATAVRNLRTDVERLTLPFEMLAPEFTFTELHTMVSIILGRHVEQSRLRQQLNSGELIVPVGDSKKLGAGRPAQLYRAA